MLGKIEVRKRSNQRMRWVDGITDEMNMNLGKLWEMVRYRKAWCSTVHRASKSQTASQVVLVVKYPPNSVEDIRDSIFITESRRSPGEGNDYPLQHSCLGNPMDKGVWWATVHRFMMSCTRWK